MGKQPFACYCPSPLCLDVSVINLFFLGITVASDNRIWKAKKKMFSFISLAKQIIYRLFTTF